MSLALDLPVDIPWRLIATSPDMMDERRGDRAFPYVWRSAISVYAYEPSLEDLPDELCEDRVTFLKVACSITGYQPTEHETMAGYQGFASRPEVDRDRVESLLRAYFACYGVLLNVSVFPGRGSSVPLSRYPHIVDFEPKVRDLYQVSTEEGEVLTGSATGVSTDKSLSTTNSTETTVALEAQASYAGVTGKAKAQHKWGTREHTELGVETESSRERRERYGSSTQIAQLYNLLTGYHAGTNRAAFLMLPRPNTLEPTDRRTFVQGLRRIEGMQEFFLVVQRRRDQETLCVDAVLETGHFPDEVERGLPAAPVYEEGREVWPFMWQVDPAFLGVGGETADFERLAPRTSWTIEDGWTIDPSKGDPGHPGITAGPDRSNDRGRSNLKNFDYRAVGDRMVQLYGKLEPPFHKSDGPAIVVRDFTIHKRRPRGVREQSTPGRIETPFFVTSRGLEICMRSSPQRCIEAVAPPSPLRESIVWEGRVSMERVGASDLAKAPRRALSRIQEAMTTNWRQPTRYPEGTVGLLDSKLAGATLIAALPASELGRRLRDVQDLDPAIAKKIGAATVADVLELSPRDLADRAGIGVEAALALRRGALGYAVPPEIRDDPAQA